MLRAIWIVRKYELIPFRWLVLEGSSNWEADCLPPARCALGKLTGHLSTKEAMRIPLCMRTNQYDSGKTSFSSSKEDNNIQPEILQALFERTSFIFIIENNSTTGTWCFQSLFLFGISFCIYVTGDMIKWKQNVVFLMELSGKFNFHLKCKMLHLTLV